MSLAINTVTPEGIVLAADSRQSYRNRKGVSRIGSDSATKLFLINDRVGVAVTGVAFLDEDGVPKNVSKFIDQFKREVEVEKLSPKEVADKLHYIFEKKIKKEEQIENLREQITKTFENQGAKILKIEENENGFKFKVQNKNGNVQEGVAAIEGIQFFVAGYNKDGSSQVYNVSIPGLVEKKRDSNQRGMEYGANWLGQTDVVARIVKGWDPRIFNTNFVNNAVQKDGQEAVVHQLNSLEYAINWGAMPIQDAVDFTVLVIQTTSALQRFSDGIQADPGDVPGVGGPIDVLVLTPEGHQWIRRKELRVE